MTDRCDGRYPVPHKREEPFPVTYRCALPMGHDGPHGDGNDRSEPIEQPAQDRLQPMAPGAPDIPALIKPPDFAWAHQRVTNMAEANLINAQVYGAKLLKGHGYPNETFSYAQDYRALSIVLDALSALSASHEALTAMQLYTLQQLAAAEDQVAALTAERDAIRDVLGLEPKE
jgi:hypothetical protein